MEPGAGGHESFLASLSQASSKVGIVTAFCTVVHSCIATNFPLPVNIYFKMLQRLQNLFWEFLGFA